jgi:FemAB-related protein (PEP-CTERM system-associated)
LSHPEPLQADAQLEQLQDQKGRLSRLIGAAKKNQQDCAELITEMQQVSAQIKQLQALKKPPAKAKKTSASKIVVKTLPGHFKTPELGAPDSQACRILHLTDSADDAQWESRWNEYVSKHPRCSAYHRYEFKHIIQQSFQQTPHYLLAINAQENIVGILPSVQLKSRLFGNFIISMPYFNYGGPIADHADIEEQLIQGLIGKASKLGIEHIELRETHARENYAVRTDKAAMILPLPATEKALWQQIGSKVRAQVKKAQSNQLSIRIGQQELLNDFYSVFAENMRDLGTPVYSKSFFSTLLKTLNEEQTGHAPEAELIIAYDQAGAAISAGFLISHKDSVEIPWASTLRSANKLNANMFLYWHVLAHCVNQHMAYFDFGRSSKEAGTFKFKKQWGAKPQQLFWHYWQNSGSTIPEINPKNPKFQLAIAIWRILPVWLTRIIGPYIVKNLP